MKILLVAPSYIPSRRANTIQTMKMAQAIQVLGHQVRVLVPDPGYGDVKDWGQLANHYGVQTEFKMEWVPVKPRFRGYDYGIKSVHTFQNWGGADILYTRYPQAAAFGSILKVPTILELHDLPSGTFGRLIFWTFLMGTGRKRLVFITTALKEAVNSTFSPLFGSQDVIVAPDGVDLTRYRDIQSPEEARRSLQRKGFNQLDSSRFTIGYTGHLYQGRGVNMILEIASQLPQFLFLIVGGNPEAVNSIRSELKRRSLENVVLTGFVPNTELPHYQAACNVLLMPYQRQVSASSGGDIGSFLSPMKMFEYLACGRVIISSNLPVLLEVLNETNAILLPPEDPDLWVSAILEIKNQNDRREVLGINARRDAKAYTWESRAARIFSAVV